MNGYAQQEIIDHDDSVKQTPSSVSGEKKVDGKGFGPGITQTNTDRHETGLGISPAKYLFSIGIVVIMMIAILWVMNRLNFGSHTERGKAFITIKNRIHFDNKNSLALVNFRDEELLVGIGTNGITLLKTYCHPTDSDTKNNALI